MKILLVSEYFYPRLGGGELIWWNIANAFSAKGHCVTVVTSQIENTPRYQCVNGIEIHRPFRRPGHAGKQESWEITDIMARIVFLVKLFPWLKKFLKQNRPQVVCAMDNVPAMLTSWCAWSEKIPVIFNVAGLTDKAWFQLTNPLVAMLKLLVVRLTIRLGKYDAVRCPSDTVFRKVQRFRQAKTNYFCIPEPLNEDEIRQAREDTDTAKVRQTLGIDSKQLFLLCVGALTTTKNFANLIRVLSSFDTNLPWKLVIVGEGPERNKLESVIDELDLSSRVTLLGQKPHEEALSTMKACDVLILPSKAETFAMVVVEALALQRPVIANRVGEVPNIESPNLHIIDNLVEIKGMLQIGLKPEPDHRIAERYSMVQITSAIERMFESVINNKKVEQGR